MDISVSTGFYYQKDYQHILDIISETDCSNIELFLNDSFLDLSLQEINQALQQRNLNVTSIHNPLALIVGGRKEEYWLKRSVKYARELGAELVVTHMSYYEQGDKKINNDWLHKQNILKYKDSDDVFVCTENLPPNDEYKSFLHTQEELYNFVQENDCCMTFDTTHWASHGRDLIAGYNLYKDYIKNIHLSDFGAGNEHKILGTGEVPLDLFLEELQQDNYDGALTIELDFAAEERNDVNNYQEAVGGLQESLDYIYDNLNK